MLFDLQTREARRLDMPSNVGFAEWLKSGETFIGYDADGGSYNVYRIDGTIARSLFERRMPLGDYVSKSPDGRYVIVTSPGGLDVMDAETGTVVQSIPDALDAAISPDGETLAYVITDPPAATPGSPHATSLVLAQYRAGSPTFSLPGRVLVTETVNQETFGLLYNPWSPDGRFVAILHMANTAAHGVEVFDLVGTRVWAAPAPGAFVYATWGGPHKLFMFPVDGVTSASAGISGTAIDVTTGSETGIASGVCCGYSPDGRYAIRVQSSAGASAQRCALLDTTTGEVLAEFDGNEADRVANFCSTISWTADSNFALASRRGG